MARNQSSKKKMQTKKNRNTKQYLVFDENARREYLTGFRKRKDERRRKAAENLLKEMKDEKKRLKQQLRDVMKSRVENQPSVPEVEHLLDPRVYDLPSHTVTITDVSEVDLTGKDGLWLGQNTFRDVSGDEAEEGNKLSTVEAANKPKQDIPQNAKEVKRLKRKMAKVGDSNFKKLKQAQQKKSRRRQRRASKPSKGRRKK